MKIEFGQVADVRSRPQTPLTIFHSTSCAKEALVLRKEWSDGEETDSRWRSDGGRSSDALDEIEPNLQHLAGLISVLRLLGQAADSVEPVAVSSLARCSGETLDAIEQSWRMAIGALRQGK